jgi:Bacterial PH domain
MPTDQARGLPGLPVTFRPVVTRVVLLGCGAVMFGVITAVSLALDHLTPWERMSFVVVAACALAGIVVLSRPKVVCTRAYVLVVNPVHSRRLDWAEIVAVNLRGGDPWVFLDLSDGTSMPAWGIQPGLSRRRAVADARALRALVEEYGTGAESRGGG